ncbi:MAG: metal ABC transporter substrate-binding protein [Roseobacter sp.]
MKRVYKFLLAAMFTVAASVASAQDRPVVVTVNYPLHYIAERLLEDAAEVVFPVPQEVDPSFWRPSIADISMIQSADLILLNGAGFATWVDRVSLPRSKLVNTSVVIEDQFIVTESITHSHGDGGEHSHEGLAAYTWLDPLLAIAQAEAIAGAVSAQGIAPADDVAEQLNTLRADFLGLDADARAVTEGLAGVTFIATHPRYQYFAKRYGLKLTSLEWGAGTMPDDEQVADLKKLIEQTGASVLIWEAAPPAGAFEIATELGLQNIVFAPLAHGTPGHSYLDAYSQALAALSEVRAE